MWNGWTGIDLLLPLQDLRESLPNAVTRFFELITATAFYLVIPILLCILIYWFYDSHKGDRLILNLITAFNLVNFIKFMVKQPRPWLLDSRIHPTEYSIEHATGYSLPSGHTAIAITGYGYAVTIIRKHWIKILLIAVAMLIVLARPFLSVHTPLDIIIGAIIALCVMIVNEIMCDLSEKSDRNFYIITAGYFVFFSILFIFILTNMDMDYLNTALTMGMLYGVLIGRTVNRRYINYTIPKMKFSKGLKIGLLGLVIIGILTGMPLIILKIDWLCFIGGLLTSFFIYYYPKYIKKWTE